MPTQVIALPNGTRIRLGRFVAAWRLLRTLPPTRQVSGWEWYAVDAAEILHRIWLGVQDRINTRGGLMIRELRPDHTERARAKRYGCQCRWCGMPLAGYVPFHSRFCGPDCRQSYYH